MGASNLEKTVATLGVLSVHELRQLQIIVTDLLATGYFDPDGAADRAAGGEPSATKGYIERKLIPDKKRGKTYGPYLYLRVWRDGVLTSKYLGKADSTEG
jgi:hypothetical protein